MVQPLNLKTIRFGEALRRVQDDGKYKNVTVDKALADLLIRLLIFKFSWIYG